MRYKVKDIVKAVKVILDENTSSEALQNLGDVDTLTLEEIIESKVEDAARLVAMSAPLYMLDGGKAFGDSIGWDMSVGRGSGRIVLPDDFLRLIIFQMADWSMPVSEAITEQDPLYARQRSRFPGIKGCPESPVVAIVNQPIGKVLEFYSCSMGEGVYIKMSRYQPVPKIEELEDSEIGRERWIDISPNCLRAVHYYAAYLVAESVQDEEHAGKYLNIGKSLINIE